jgi:hypothetical protein
MINKNLFIMHNSAQHVVYLFGFLSILNSDFHWHVSEEQQ